MTVNASPSFVLYAGDGISTVMPVPFYTQNSTDIYAVKFNADTLAPTPLVLGTDYTVQNAGQQSGAQLTLVVPLPVGVNLYVDRSNIVVDQQTDFVPNDKFPSEANENALDKLTMLMQLLKNASSSSIRYPTFEFRDGTLPAAPERSGGLLGFDSNGVVTIVPLGASIGAGDLKDDIFIAANGDFTPGTTTQLTLSRSYGAISNIFVFFDSAWQGPDQIDSLVGAALTFKDAIPEGITEVYVRGGTTLSAFVPSSESITDDMVATNAGIDASKLAFKRPEAGAVRRTISSKLIETVSIKDFGASLDPDGDDTESWLNVLAAFQPETVTRGVNLLVPAGVSNINHQLDFAAWSLLHEITIEGDGPVRTSLNFAGAPAGSHGLTFNTGSHISIRHMSILSTPGRGIWLGRTNDDTTVGSNTFFDLQNLRIQSCGTGLKITNSWMGAFRDLWIRNSGGNGVEFDGFFTSMLAERCYSSDNAGVGWVINGGIYSNFVTCSGDSNGGPGFALSNLRSVNFHGCGTESNVGAGFHVVASPDSVAGIPSNVQDIHGVNLIGCYGIANSNGSPGTFGGFMEVGTTTGRTVDLKIMGGSSAPGQAADRALILSGASGGKITVHKELFDDSAYSSSDFIVGAVEVKNATVSGRYAHAGLTAATQSIPHNVLTTVSISLSNDDLGGTISGGNAIVIPRGVYKIQVYASCGFDANASGIRQVQVLKNGAPFNGGPGATINAVVAGGTILQCSVSPVPVNEGDTISFQVLQSSGAPLNLLQGNSTYLIIEAVS